MTSTVLPGRMVDKAAFVETIRRCSCPDAIIIADKGFYSKANLSYLMEKKLRFMLPLQENTTMIPPSFDEHDGDGRYDGRFTYKGRNIWYKVIPTGDRGNRIFIYQDDFRKAEYNSLFTERQEKESLPGLQGAMGDRELLRLHEEQRREEAAVCP